MSPQHYILATAGHVDHGKSALVKALTGSDPDRLPEEKARGITIDLGFAHLSLAAPGGADSGGTQGGAVGFELGWIDVPGHEDFVKNMVAGVGSIDLALLVVAADDGWMPQTEEHLQILSYLGVQHGVVALTKADLAVDVSGAVHAVRQHLSHSPLRAAPIVPTSVVSGSGLAELRTALCETLAQTPVPRDIGKPRLSVDRVFQMRGVGTVVTGTLSGGRLNRGQPVQVQPRGGSTRIRALQSHHQDLESAGPGTRVALNLPEVEGGVERGDVVTLPGLGEPSTVLDVLLEKSDRLRNSQAPAARPLKDGTLVRVHLGSGNVPARVRLASGKTLEAGERTLAQLRLEAPLWGGVGDRLILRDSSEQATLAGGVVLDPAGERAGFGGAARQAFLADCARSVGVPAATVRAWVARWGAVERAALLVRSRWSAGELATALDELAQDGAVVLDGNLALDREWWEALRLRASECIEAHHRAHPDSPGLSLSDLRTAVAQPSAASAAFDCLLRELKRHGYVVKGTVIGNAGFRPALPPELQGAGTRLREALAARPFDPPSRKELAPDRSADQALRYLVRTGEAVELSAEVVLSAEALARARQIIAQLLRSGGRATASEIRLALGSNRRVTIPLLEHLDRQGFTRREGDHRVLRDVS